MQRYLSRMSQSKLGLLGKIEQRLLSFLRLQKPKCQTVFSEVTATANILILERSRHPQSSGSIRDRPDLEYDRSACCGTSRS